VSTAVKCCWMRWSEIPWLSRSEAGGGALQLSERLLEASLDAVQPIPFLNRRLPEITTEFSAQWCSIYKRTPQWTRVSESGRRGFEDIPQQFLDEALDRDAGGFYGASLADDWRFLAAPIGAGRSANGDLLVMAGRNLSENVLSAAVAVARVLGVCLGIVERHAKNLERLDRLASTLEVATAFSRTRESQPLLELVANAATRILNCERASIFLWDRYHHELIACPALGMNGASLRLPDTAGVVGEVVQTGKSIRVDDAYRDPRFDKSVDLANGFTTRNLLCQPLRDAEGNLIGAFEVLNRTAGPFTDDDSETLVQLGVPAASALENAREREQMVRSIEQLTEQVTQGVQIIGESPAIVALRATVIRLAATDLPVLILGESGTGKEVVAQSLHFQGTRAALPFIAVNCAALAESLLESELFGHEKGAFTDARELRRGKFELAEGGTLFLDEIGDMSLSGQAKLLRVLEQKVVTRVGGSQNIAINVRVVAATNTNLMEAVRQRKFREDLYYRLSVVTQVIPPLRDRPEDILPLAEYFLRQFCARARRPSLKMSSDAKRRLQAHSWPGNVRELRNLMERVVYLGTGDKVEADDLAFILNPGRDTALEPSDDLSLDVATRRFQQEFIRRSIKRVQGNMSEAARLLGVHRSNLYRKMRQLEMSEVGGAE
jgi:transcriptional regulator with GAF, ATPase, and Fis domain